MVTKEKKLELIKKFGKSETDTGNIAVQVAILTEDIESLKSHFEKNKKDNHSKRGFLAKIEKRKKLLAYIRSENFDEYAKLIKELGLRK